MQTVDIYTDGSWRPHKPGTVGWGLLVTHLNDLDNEILRRNGAVEDPVIAKSRNASGELFGAVMAANIASQWGVKIRLHYDFEGVEKFITHQWKTKSALSIQYYREMRPLYEKGLIEFIKIDAHVNPGNIIVDQLAKDAIDGYLVQ